MDYDISLKKPQIFRPMQKGIDFQKTFRVLYQTELSKILCIITPVQRHANTPPVTVVSPNNSVPETLYRNDSLSTSYAICIDDLEGGTFVDYINSVAYCITKYKLPFSVVVAAGTSTSYMAYSPQEDLVPLYFSKNPANLCEVASLREECVRTYASIKLLGVNSNKISSS